jgi:Ca2+-binding RTX toxin-like protein
MAGLAFTDSFSPASTLWSNSIGNWTSVGGDYYALAPSNGPLTYSGLPFDLLNTDTFSITVTINSLRDEGIWLDTDGTNQNGVLLVLGGNAQRGNWAYWHVVQSGDLSAPLDVNTTAFVPDLTYTVTVVVSGNTYQAYNDPDGVFDANSVLLTTLVDNTYTHGQVGLYDFYAATSFSNFSLSSGVSNANQAPTAVALSNTTASIAENTSTASDIKVADINVTDDGLGSNILALTGADAAFFEIVGSALYLKAGTVLDFEMKSSYAVAVTVDDPIVGGTPDAISAVYILDISNIPGVTISGTNSADVIDATHTVAGQPLPTNEEDTINAGGGNDTINALSGNDFINGGTGADTMFGGTGNDTYVVDNRGDVVNETGGDGLDTVQSAITFNLSDAVHAIGAIENLTLTGTAAINATGNALSNLITGNNGNNIIAGLGGADHLDGGGGTDTATYAASSAGVKVSLMTGVGSGGDAGIH